MWIGLRGQGMKIEDRGLRMEDRRSKAGRLCAILYPLASILVLHLTGCGPSKEPEEVWCETGTAPGQVVYPRAIAYAPKDDTFFIIDRVAHVQHLDRDGKYLGGWQMPRVAARQAGRRVGRAGRERLRPRHPLPPRDGLHARRRTPAAVGQGGHGAGAVHLPDRHRVRRQGPHLRQRVRRQRPHPGLRRRTASCSTSSANSATATASSPGRSRW